MKSATPSMLDTYGLTYAFTAVILIAGLFAIDRFAITLYSPAYVGLLAAPFLLGPATVFALDSDDGPRTVLLRAGVLAPLAAVTGVTFLYTAMIVIILPLSFFVMPTHSTALTPMFSVVVILAASPMIVSFMARVREGMSVQAVAQMIVLVAVACVIAWLIAETFAPGDTLYTFIRKDVAKHFAGAFAWYLPMLALGASLWRRSGLV